MLTYQKLALFILLGQISLSHGMNEPFMCKVPLSREESTVSQEKQKVDAQATEDDESMQRFHRLAEKFSREHNFTMLHPIIEQEVAQAFEACNITEPIIVLQDEHSGESACYPLVDELYYPVKALVVGVEGPRASVPLPAIRASIYHECGHILAGDVEQPPLKKTLPFMFASLGAALYAGIKCAHALNHHNKAIKATAGIIGGIATTFTLGRLYHKTVGAYKTRIIERNADIFAIQKLLAQDDCYAVMFDFLEYTYLMDAGKRNFHGEFWLFHDHPEYRERAGIILDELKKANIDFKNLPTEGAVYADTHPRMEKCDMQERFNKQVKKYFPEYENA